METKTATIQKVMVPSLQATLAKLNKRATKLGVDPVTMTVANERVELKKVRNKEVAYTLVDVTISLNIPKLADWSLVCTIQHTAAGNLLLTVPSAGAMDLSAYRTCAPNCEHCNKPRNRRDTYVVQHADGTRKQVGKDCLVDFTGYGKTAEQTLAHMEWIAGILDFLGSIGGEDGDYDHEGGYSSGPEGVGLNCYLSFVVAVSRVLGFRSKKYADEANCNSTRDEALLHMDPPRGFKGTRIMPTDEDKAFALEARNWGASIDAKSDFDHNLKVICSNDAVLFRNTGIAAYVVEAYKKHLGQIAERKSRPESKHFGEVGKRLRDLKLTYKRGFSFDSQFGVCFIHIFVTEDGSDATWKTSSEALCKVGETVTVDATVKAHSDYKGRPQTELSRVKDKTPRPQETV